MVASIKLWAVPLLMTAVLISAVVAGIATRCPKDQRACGKLCYDPKTQSCGDGGNMTCGSGIPTPDVVCNSSDSTSGSLCSSGRGLQFCYPESQCCPAGQRGCGCSANTACFDPKSHDCVPTDYGNNHAVCPKGLKGCGDIIFNHYCYDSGKQKCILWCQNLEANCLQIVCGLDETACGVFYQPFCCPKGTTCAGDGASYGRCVEHGHIPCPNSFQVQWTCPQNSTCGTTNECKPKP